MSTVTVHYEEKTAHLETDGRRSLLELLREAGLAPEAPCGGNGVCGKCRVELDGAGGRRTVLACRTVPAEDCAVYLPEAGARGAGDILTDGAPAAAGDCDAREGYGAAVDLGTTTVALRLFRLADGAALGEAGGWNAQRPYGADVITRIQYTMEHPEGLGRLCSLIRGQIAALLEPLCGARHAAVTELFVAGNTIMQHLAAGLDPAGIAAAPFAPKSRFDEPGRADAWPELPGVAVRYAPCVSGYVGGDITAGLLAAGPRGAERSLFLDIGTNGEMALGGPEGFLCCSVACGPAFEGAEIACGMPGVAGAVSHVDWGPEGPVCRVIGGGAPTGLCGSGLVDLLALLLRRGAVDGSGRLLPRDEAPEDVRPWLGETAEGQAAFFLTDDGTVYLGAADVRKLQLAKAAVAAGIATLLNRAGLTPEEVPALYLAGGFGNRIDPRSAAEIGMFPPALAERIVGVGNSSLTGACRALLSAGARAELLELQRRCRYLELSADPAFCNEYIDQMRFGEETEDDE